MSGRQSASRSGGKYKRSKNSRPQMQVGQVGRPRQGFYGSPQRYIGSANGFSNSRFGVDTRGPERKFIDTFKPPSGVLKGYGIVSGPAVPVLLNGIVQATDFFERIGRTVTFKSLTVNVSVAATRNTYANSLQYDPAVLGTYVNRNDDPFGYRVIIYYDRQPNLAIHAITDLLWPNAYTAGVTAAANVNTTSFNNLNNKDRFMIIYDKKVTLNSCGGQSTLFFKKHKKMNLETQFTGPTGAMNQIQTGAFFLLAFGDRTDTNTDVSLQTQTLTEPGAVAVVDGLVDNWRVRMRYIDT